MLVSARPLSPDSGRPPTSTVPAVGLSSPARCHSRVVFPAPDGPSSATISPGSMTRSTPRSAATSLPGGAVHVHQVLAADGAARRPAGCVGRRGGHGGASLSSSGRADRMSATVATATASRQQHHGDHERDHDLRGRRDEQQRRRRRRGEEHRQVAQHQDSRPDAGRHPRQHAEAQDHRLLDEHRGTQRPARNAPGDQGRVLVAPPAAGLVQAEHGGARGQQRRGRRGRQEQHAGQRRDPAA